MDQQAFGNLLTNYEAEHLIEKLGIIDIEEYGSNKWFKQDEVYNRLNMQAHINAMVKSDEFIMDSMVTFDKVKVLIYDLIQTEVWKQKVLPLLKEHLLHVASYRSYIVVYHEAVICNLLEVILYHRTAVDSAEEFLIELIEYCYRKLLMLTKHPQTKKVEKKTVEQVLKQTRSEEYQSQIDEIEFKIGMMCLSIIRFLTDYVRFLPVSVVHHLLEVTDILCVLVPLIESKPWIRTSSTGEREKFDNSKWVVVDKSEYSRIVKLEANVWIAVYNLFMEPECRKKYELSEFRKSNMLRLRKYMNEILLDQIPNLSHMLRALEELSIMNVQSMTKNNPFIVQQVPEVRDSIQKGKNWVEIAERQKREFFVNDKEQAKQDMQRLADLYGQNIMDGLTDGFKCELCKKEATKRCSRCKTVWYCTRECQVQYYHCIGWNQCYRNIKQNEQLAHWKEHKVACQVIVEGNDAKEKRKQDLISEATKENGNGIVELNKVEENKAPLVVEVEAATGNQGQDLDTLD